MAGNSAGDGQMIWVGPTTSTVEPTTTNTTTLGQNNNYFTTLYACNILTNVVGISIKIKVGVEFWIHIELKKITSVDVVNNMLKVNTKDTVPFFFLFISTAEALKALNKIDDAINGLNVICTDPQIQSQLTLVNLSYNNDFTFPNVIFADGNIIGEVFNQQDAIDALNAYSQGLYSVDYGNDEMSFQFSVLPINEKFLPKTISCICTFFTVEVGNQDVNFISNYSTQDKFWFAYNNTVIEGSNNAAFSFKFPGLNMFNYYWVNPFLSFLNLSDIGVLSIEGQMPPQLQNLVLISTSLSDLSFLNSLTVLTSLDLEKTPVLSTNFDNNPLLRQLILQNCSINSFTSTVAMAFNLIVLNNLFITSLPDLNANSLNSFTCTGCTFLNIVGSLVDTLSLQTYILTDTQISNAPDFSSTTSLKKIVVSNSINLTTFSSLAANVYLNYVDLSQNDFTSTTVETIAQQLVDSNVMMNGYLNLSNQYSNLDFSSISDTFTNNINYLQAIKGWTVVLN